MASAVLDVAARHGDMELFQAFLARGEEVDGPAGARAPPRRTRRASATRPSSRSRSRVTLSPDFDARESIAILSRGGDRTARRVAVAWAFLKANFDRLAARLPRESPAGFPWLASGFSDDAHRAEVEAFFKDKAAELHRRPAAPRAVARADPAPGGASGRPAGERGRLPEELSGQADDRPQAAGGDVAGRRDHLSFGTFANVRISATVQPAENTRYATSTGRK